MSIGGPSISSRVGGALAGCRFYDPRDRDGSHSLVDLMVSISSYDFSKAAAWFSCHQYR